MARMPYVTEEELNSNQRSLIDSSLQSGRTLNIYSAIANNPEILEGLRAFLKAIWNDSGLSDRQREIVILTTASEIGAEYEWHQHVNIAADSDLNRSQINAIAYDDRSPFSIEEQALIAYSRAVVEGRVNDPLHDAVAEYFDEKSIVGIVTTAAGYLALGKIIDTLDIEIESQAEFVGWCVE